MATRYPLIIDSTTNNKIKELPSGDDLNLSGSSIVNVINATASGTVTANAVEVTSNTFSVAGNSLNQVAFTGNYNDLSNTPTVFNGNYDNLTNKPTLKTTIESLDNVSTTAPADNQVLQYDSSSSTYKPSSIVSVSSSSIDALLDVNVSNIASAAGQILKWDGSAWIRGNASSGSDADTLDSFEGTYYLNANNFTNYKVITSVAGDTGSFTTSTSSDTVNIQGGTGISTAITSNTLTITNDSPDQTVAFTDGTNITVTGTYPNFTIATDAVTATLSTISVASNSSPSGSGSIAFNQSTGAITFTPPDLSSYLTSVGVLSSHTDVDVTAPTSGQVLKWNGTAWAPATESGGGGLANISEDTTPQLGGDLDINGKTVKHTFVLNASGSDHYVFTDTGNIWFPSSENDPTIYLRRGEQYVFSNQSGGHPLEIRSALGGSAYSTGVTNNGGTGDVTFKVPMSAPATLYYQCTSHANMNGTINII
jgi:hypothetical protein